jgi:putative ABC transport system substrate-binding protein
MMDRRDFIALVGGAIATWPFNASAQQPARPVIGFLNGTTPDPFLHRVAAFREGLAGSGYIVHQNVAVEYRWASNQTELLPALAANLVRHPVDVIAVTGGTDAALAAKTATSKTPIVFGIGGDPIAAGLVGSLGIPDGNLTGTTLNAFGLVAKQLELLRELLPRTSTIAVLVNPENRHSQTRASVEAAARTVGARTLILDVSNQIAIDVAFKTVVDQHVDALLIGSDPYLASRREDIVALAARYAVPTMYQFLEFVGAGGLISFGSSLTAGYHQVGAYVGKILRGAKPADLPVIQSNKFELAINLTAAKRLGLTVPPALLGRADKVIQ